jgi:DNA polymerase-3 subunit beta
MKVVVAVEELKKKLNQVRAVVDTKSTIPVLGFVRVEAKEGKLRITGNDLSASLSVELNGKVEGEGALLLPAAPTAQVLGLLTTPEVTLSNVDSETGPYTHVVFDAGKEYNATFKTPKPDAFPEPDAVPTEIPIILIGVSTLQQLIERVIFCVPEADGKTNISVGLLESDGQRLRAVGTDGFKLAIAEADGPNEVFQFNLPKTAMTLLRGISGDKVSISESDTAFFFITESETLIVRKVHGQFPPYQRILPSEHKTEVTLSAKAFQDSLSLTLPIANPEEPRVQFTTAENSIILAATSDEIGSGQTSVPATFSGAPADIILNADFLFSFLKEASNIENPLTVRVQASDKIVDFHAGPDYRFLIMPIAAQ